MNDITITEDELQLEYARLDSMRNTYEKNRQLLTDDQFKLIQYARAEKDGKVVSWPEICNYFESNGWGNIPETTLKNRYDIEKRRRNIV